MAKWHKALPNYEVARLSDDDSRDQEIYHQVACCTVKCLELSENLSIEVLCIIECIVMTLERSFPMSLARIGTEKQSPLAVCILPLKIVTPSRSYYQNQVQF